MQGGSVDADRGSSTAKAQSLPQQFLGLLPPWVRAD
jgi:hypothetical protein